MFIIFFLFPFSFVAGQSPATSPNVGVSVSLEGTKKKREEKRKEAQLVRKHRGTNEQTDNLSSFCINFTFSWTTLKQQQTQENGTWKQLPIGTDWQLFYAKTFVPDFCYCWKQKQKDKQDPLNSNRTILSLSFSFSLPVRWPTKKNR